MNKMAEHCENCIHLKFEQETNFWYCDLDLEPNIVSITGEDNVEVPVFDCSRKKVEEW